MAFYRTGENSAHPKVREAYAYASRKHEGQTYGDKPYMYHINQVLFWLDKFFPLSDSTADLHVAATLHDTIEDTNASYEEIQELFGKNVADMVDGVTNIKIDNKTDKVKTFAKTAKRWDSTTVKLADRLANTAEGEKNGKYRKEMEGFEAILYKADWGHDAMWQQIHKHLE